MTTIYSIDVPADTNGRSGQSMDCMLGEEEKTRKKKPEILAKC